MSKFEDALDFSDCNGQQLVDKLNQGFNDISIANDALKRDVVSGSVNRIPFYADVREAIEFQKQLGDVAVALTALMDTKGDLDLWLITKQYALPIMKLIKEMGIASINNVVANINRNITLKGDSNIGIVEDPTNNSISINADGLKSIVDTKIASITSPKGTIDVAGSTDKTIDIAPASTVDAILSPSSGNLAHKDSSGLLVVNAPTDVIKSINSTPGDGSGNFEIIGGNGIDINTYNHQADLSINPEEVTTSVVSSDANNALHVGTDNKLFVAAAKTGANVVSLNGLQGNVNLVEGSNITITKSTQALTISASGGGGGSNDDAVQDTVYFDDNSKSIDPEDGTLERPFKTLYAAINAASENSETNDRPWKVIAKDGASLDNNETITVGGVNKRLSIEVIAPYMKFSGGILLDLRSNVDIDKNLFMITVDEFGGNIGYINPVFVAPTATRKEGVAVEMRCNRKRVISDTPSFLCDLELVANDGDVLENRYLTYVERCDEIIEASGTGTAVSSIAYQLNDKLADTFIRVQCYLSILNTTSPTASSTPYIAFQGTNLKDSVVRSSYIEGLANNGIIYDYLTSIGASDSSHLMAQSVDSLKAKFQNAEIDGLTATTTLNLPKNNNQHAEGQLGYDPVKQDIYYVDGTNRRIYLGHNQSAGVSRFQAYGDAEVNITSHHIDMPAMEIGVYDENDHRQSDTIAMDPFAINWQLDGTGAVKPLDEHDQQADGNFYGVCVCKIPVDLTANCVFTDTSIALGRTSTDVKFSVALADKNKMLENLIPGCTITLSNAASPDKTVSMIIYHVTSIANGANEDIIISGYSNIGHGKAITNAKITPYVPPVDLASSNGLNFNTISVGDYMSFDPSKGRFDPMGDNNGEFIEMNYYPVFYQDKMHADTNACVLIGYNPRFASETTAQERSFWKGKIPKIIGDTLTQKWGGTSVALYQQISLHFKGGLGNASLNVSNRGRHLAFENVRFHGNTYSKYRKFGNTAGEYGVLNPEIAYGTKTVVANTSSSSPKLLASFIQDEVSIYNVYVSFADMTSSTDINKFLNLKIGKANSVLYDIYSPEVWKDSVVIRSDRIIALGERSDVREKNLVFQLKRTGAHTTNSEKFFYYKVDGITLPLRRELLHRHKANAPAFPMPQIPVTVLSTAASQDEHKTAHMT